MPVTDRTVRLSRQARKALDGIVDQATRDLVIAWATAWDEIAVTWQAAVDDLIGYQAANGTWPPAWRIARAERAQQALQAAAKALVDVSDTAGARITQDLPALTGQAADWEARLIASQMPPAPVAGDMSVAATFNRVDPDALTAIVQRTTGQVTALAYPLAAEAVTAMNRELIRGIAVGDNPRIAAARMLARVEGRFNGGLARAMTIARTEMLDAHREASRVQRIANADVLAGWQWQATLDTRTCPSCLAQHGSMHAVDETGPTDHQNGRCTALPVTKSWRDLGFDIDEPASPLPDARAWFDGLPQAEQRAILGPTRLEMLHTGRIGWADLSTRKSAPGWRDSHHVRSVRDLEGLAGAADGSGGGSGSWVTRAGSPDDLPDRYRDPGVPFTRSTRPRAAWGAAQHALERHAHEAGPQGGVSYFPRGWFGEDDNDVQAMRDLADWVTHQAEPHWQDAGALRFEAWVGGVLVRVPIRPEPGTDDWRVRTVIPVRGNGVRKWVNGRYFDVP
ncbi:phage head morphogenesis protein, SPP1 gp7 family [Xylanimonas cellulosilytica DSM 15894]|uniref:Phage head morphogenesis protein, SPP1 gp7 family n=1 Tax=Xylanimonas cellulosilytica (strain DSM 15894 / JCM 12276 / CECT 5975 / KCTC 9989 / LMG 20990 / NBRC 107835 / XIL07) TaxID=446471 RepID=D1BW76_XYLCX|nr:phage minor head protein [Xylanimonas cellulosilytica]ACZ29579.1 phage head morphogenesis protein, SPP1 gp7 family [Xylanimonas cellulosilytica DSM 15894]